jgi:hypothetical protein
MGLWDRDALDLVGPAFIELNKDGSGRFRFIAVDGYLDWKNAEHTDGSRVEFTWEGSDEGDRASGRGWAERHVDGSLRGRIFFHAGDDSGFRAVAASRLA